MYDDLQERIKINRENIQKIQEENFGVSKSIVIMQPSYREPLTVEDKRAAKIILLEKEIKRDQEMVDELDRVIKYLVKMKAKKEWKIRLIGIKKKSELDFYEKETLKELTVLLYGSLALK